MRAIEATVLEQRPHTVTQRAHGSRPGKRRTQPCDRTNTRLERGRKHHVGVRRAQFGERPSRVATERQFNDPYTSPPQIAPVSQVAWAYERFIEPKRCRIIRRQPEQQVLAAPSVGSDGLFEEFDRPLRATLEPTLRLPAIPGPVCIQSQTRSRRQFRQDIIQQDDLVREISRTHLPFKTPKPR